MRRFFDVSSCLKYVRNNRYLMRVENITSRPRSRFVSSKEEEIEQKVEKKAAGRWTSLMFSSSNDVESGKVREKLAQIIVSLTMSVTMGTDLRATISIFLAFTSAPFSADFILYTLPFAVVLIQSRHNTYLKRIYVRIWVTYIHSYVYTKFSRNGEVGRKTDFLSDFIHLRGF